MPKRQSTSPGAPASNPWGLLGLRKDEFEAYLAKRRAQATLNEEPGYVYEPGTMLSLRKMLQNGQPLRAFSLGDVQSKKETNEPDRKRVQR